MSTPSIKLSEVTRKWYVVDASKAPLGRVATVIANALIGKHKPTYTPHVDGGDYVVVINADKIVLTGRKAEQKTYYRHSGYIGGIKQKSYEQLKSEDPTQIIEKAVRGMLPRNKLHGGRLQRLKVYAGSEHNHEAQKPEELTLEKGK